MENSSTGASHSGYTLRGIWRGRGIASKTFTEWGYFSLGVWVVRGEVTPTLNLQLFRDIRFTLSVYKYIMSDLANPLSELAVRLPSIMKVEVLQVCS